MNAEDLERQIERLTAAVAKAGKGERVEWRAVWDDIRTIGAAFKGARFPDPAQREDAWNRFQAAVEGVKAEQERQRGRREKLAHTSSEHRWHVQRLVDAAAPDDGLGHLMVAMLTGGASLIVKDVLDNIFGKSDEVAAELRRRSALLREARDYLSANKGEMLGADKAAAFEGMKGAQARLDDDWAKWKQTLEEAKAERHRQYLERQARREEREAKRRVWLENQNAFIARLEDSLERLAGARARRQAHIEELREKRAEAWSDGYQDRVDGWIAEEESNIADIEDKMRGVADKLAEAKGRLG